MRVTLYIILIYIQDVCVSALEDSGVKGAGSGQGAIPCISFGQLLVVIQTVLGAYSRHSVSAEVQDKIIHIATYILPIRTTAPQRLRHCLPSGLAYVAVLQSSPAYVASPPKRSRLGSQTSRVVPPT